MTITPPPQTPPADEPAPRTPLRLAIAANIRVEAAQHGATITSIAEALNTNRPWVTRRWKGEHIELDDIDPIADAIGTTRERLIYSPH